MKPMTTAARNPLAHIHNYTVPDWSPLERAIAAAGLPAETAGEFMWMCENPNGQHQYKHRLTRRYVHLRSTEAPEAGVQAVKGAIQVF